MTKPSPQQRSRDVTAGLRRCTWCRQPIARSDGPGRPKKFCSQKCRQWDWVSRQRAAELELSENELVVARTELDELKDLVFVLQCAVHDVRTDIAGGRHTQQSLRELLEWLLDAAEPVTTASLGRPL
ncbi:MAG: hypothetical protein ACKOBO_04910 [Acidimicrobiales bacterium]